MLHLLRVAVIADLNGRAVFRHGEPVLYIKRHIAFVFGHTLNIQVVFILFFDKFQHLPGYSLPLIIRVYQHIMDLCQRLGITRHPDKADQLVTVHAVSTVEECISALYSLLG